MNDEVNVEPMPDTPIARPALNALLNEQFIGIDGIFASSTVTLSESFVWNIHAIYVTSPSATTLTINSGKIITFDFPAGFWAMEFSVPIVIPNRKTVINVSVGTVIVITRKG
ncbi:MAG: hypothetical protein QXT45_07035 [Candidatus Bilamarchaeaceae archaeon]